MAYTGATFSFEHNAADPIIERLAWLTDVLPHRDGSEQRRQVRLYPRRQLEYGVLPVTPLERQSLENFLRRYHRETFLLPIWTDSQVLAVQADSGQDTVALPTTTYDYDAGEYVVLWRDYATCEAVQIESVAANALTLTENLTSTWPVGTVVLPARLARLAQSLKGTHIGQDVRPLKLQFDIDEASVSVNRFAAYSPTQYRSIDLLPGDFTDLNEPQEFSLESLLRLIDAQTGKVTLDAGANPISDVMIGYQRLLENRTAISEWLAFLKARAGRRVPLFLSLLDEDFTPVSAITLPTKITYTSNGFAALYNDQGSAKDAVITVRQSVVGFSIGHTNNVRITAVVDNEDGTETMTLSGADTDLLFQLNLAPSKFKISLLRYCRLAADVHEIAWPTNCVAQTKGSFKELNNVP